MANQPDDTIWAEFKGQPGNITEVCISGKTFIPDERPEWSACAVGGRVRVACSIGSRHHHYFIGKEIIEELKPKVQVVHWWAGLDGYHLSEGVQVDERIKGGRISQCAADALFDHMDKERTRKEEK